MKLHIFPMILLTALIQFAHAQTEAQSDVYLCIDEQGHKEYKNTGGIKGCKKVDLPGITTISPPPRKAAAPTTVAKAAATPADFPKVDNGTQKTRDNDRKQILLDEMKIEEQKLASLTKEFNGGEPERQSDEKNFSRYQERVAKIKENIGRTEKNVEALRREIGNLK